MHVIWWFSLYILYVASLSLCIGSCWCIGDSKYKDSTLHIQAERTQIPWRWPSLGCCFHEDYNIMACRICINRFRLVGDKAIIPVGFPIYTWVVGANPQVWMPINTQAKDCTASMRSAWVAPISPNILFQSWTDTFQKSVQSWYIPFALQVWYHKNKNIERHTAHTIGSWPNPKQWAIVHTSDLMMIIRQSIYIYSLNHHKGSG